MNPSQSSLPAIVAAALASRGLEPARAVLLSPLGTRKGGRLAWRVELAGGRTVKARALEDAGAAERLCALREDLEPAFARVIARVGSVLIEEWVEGKPLNRATAAQIETAGALLGRLHARALPLDVLPRAPTRAWIERGRADMAALADAGRLDGGAQAALLEYLDRTDPGACANVRIHTDFCADNIVVDAGGRLRVIDNECITIGPPGFDLGCTLHRWPMTDTQWDSVMRGYRAAAPAAPLALDFWRLVAVLAGTRIDLRYAPQRVADSAELLAGLVASES